MADKLPRYMSVHYARAFAALAVAAYHLGQYYPDILPGMSRPFDRFGWAGVDLFFVISGFVMSITFPLRGEWGNSGRASSYLMRRIIRIYPNYWICCLIFLLFGGVSGYWHFAEQDWFRSLFLIPQKIQYHVIPQAWTLQYEMLYYIIYTLCVWMGRRGLALLSAWALIVALAQCVIVYEPTPDFSWTQFLFSAFHFQFLAGVATGMLVRSGRTRWFRPAAILAAICLATMMWLNMTSTYPEGLAHGSLRLWRGVGFSLTFGLLVYAIAAWEQQRGIILQNPLIISIGDASLTLYLMSLFILHLWFRLWYEVLAFNGPVILILLVYSLCGMACVIAYSLLHYRLIERPLLKVLRKSLTGRNA